MNSKLVCYFQITLALAPAPGKMSDWKQSVEETYQQWKYNDMHNEIKTYFNEAQHQPFGEPFKKESSPLVANLSELKDNITEKKKSENVVKKQDDNTIDFLGNRIDVGEEDEEEVDNFCKETIFGGFWKTMTKLCNAMYLAVKSVGDVLKKLLKKLVDFFAAGMKKSVIAIGNVVAKIVAWAYPLPDYVEHTETGVLSVMELEFNNYGETVKNVPKVTFFPKSIAEIKKVIM